jgi:hypothetical protein
MDISTIVMNILGHVHLGKFIFKKKSRPLCYPDMKEWGNDSNIVTPLLHLLLLCPKLCPWAVGIPRQLPTPTDTSKTHKPLMFNEL